MKKDNAFTLMELVMVVIILGILISVAVPLSQEAILRTRIKDAKSNLRAMYAAQKAYAMKYDDFYASDDETEINKALHLELERGYWDYEAIDSEIVGKAVSTKSPILTFVIRYTSGEPVCDPSPCNY